MKQTVLKFGLYGLITAVVLFLGGLLMGTEMDYDTQEVIGYLTMIVSLSFIFFGIKYYRDRVNEGTVHFGKAFQIGMLIAFFTALGIAIADFIYTTLINPNFSEEYKAIMEAQGYQGEIPEYSSGFMAFLMFITVVMIGLVISLISALILRRTR